MSKPPTVKPATVEFDVPPPIELVHGGRVVQMLTFGELAKYVIDRDRRTTSSAAGIRAGARIENALIGDLRCECVNGVERGFTVMQVGDLRLLAEILAEPTCGYPELTVVGRDGQPQSNLPVARQLLPFLDHAKGAAEALP